MGETISKQPVLSPVKLEDYQEVSVPPSEVCTAIPNRRFLRNRFTHIEMEEYLLEFVNEAAMLKYRQVFNWRMAQQHVVRTLHFHITKEPECCSKICMVKVYTERVTIRLSDIKDIPYPDNLYMLMAAADAFDKIVEMIGYFDIQEDMIGVNSQGHIKVWINEDLSSVSLDMESYDCKNQKEMALRLLRIIDENTDKESEPTSLMTYINSRCTNLSFIDLIVLAKQYARINKVNIPHNFGCVLDIISQSSHTESRRSLARTQQSVPDFKDNLDMRIVKPMPSQNRLPALQEVVTPAFRGILPLPNQPIQRSEPANVYFRRQKMVTELAPISPPEIRQYKTPVIKQDLTPLSARSKPLSYNTYMSPDSSPFRPAKQGDKDIRLKVQKINPNLWTGQTRTSSQFQHYYKGDKPYSQQITPRKMVTNSNSPYVKPLSNSPGLCHAGLTPLHRVPSTQTKFQPQSRDPTRQVKSYKNKTLQQTPTRYQSKNELSSPVLGIGHPKEILKKKYEMDPQIANDLARFYKRHQPI